MTDLFEPASFRDPHNRVFYRDGNVLRAVSAEAFAAWQTLTSKKFYRRFAEDGRIIRTESVEEASPRTEDGLPYTAVLRHEQIPFVSYYYEWSFSQLKDAAVLYLEILAAALHEKMILKDATPFNIQWQGAHPVFIDVPSIVPWTPGDIWDGYRQFCEMFLCPLLLQSHKGVSFRPWLRGSIDGIAIDAAAKIFSRGHVLHAGVFKDIFLHAQIKKRFADTPGAIRKDLKESQFGLELIQANVKRLHKLVTGLHWKAGDTPWTRYAQIRSYSEDDYARKAQFVKTWAGARHRRLTWDLGCNTGDFSRIAAESSDTVIAFDSDEAVIDRLYHRLKTEKSRRILPLVMNLADASPSLGWRGRERGSLESRGLPDLVLCLAMIHHLCISGNLPLGDVVDYLASLKSDLIVEFVDRTDPMCQRLMINKEHAHSDYQGAHFEKHLTRYFEIQDTLVLSQGHRTVYACRYRT